MSFQPSDTLKSRTYIGLILAQFLAAFNDQAIHIVAIFYATDMLVRFVALPGFDEKAVISIVTACFISPFFLFSPLAGMLADRYSKQPTLIFWKLAEVGMMGLVLVGFVLPHLAGGDLGAARTLAVWSAVLVVAGVFLMGTHSAFFVPAKYGVMPEILQPSVLSQGNGFLEGTSFTAQIIGTAFGGFMYGLLKSSITDPGENTAKVLQPGREWIIGLVLFLLAVVGAAASFLIRRMPAAAPDRPLTWKLWRPLQANVGVLLRSPPLALSVLGIAFFAFMTLFLRQTLLYDGETAKELQEARQMVQRAAGKAGIMEDDDPEEDFVPVQQASAKQRTELRVALLIALVGLGIGIGSPLAGFLSGSKVELGLVPIGAFLLIFFTAGMAGLTRWPLATVACLILIGIAAGFYIVPLYTLLQHRAPKDSKGNLVATSNFINVAGGLLAVGVFYLLTFTLEKLWGLNLSELAVLNDPALLPRYVQELETQKGLPILLYLTASLMTLGIVLLLWRQLPDFFVRTVFWLRTRGLYRLQVVGQHHLPSQGPCILATNCDRFLDCLNVVAATERFTRFILLENGKPDAPYPLLRWLTRQAGLVTLNPEKAGPADWREARDKATATLGREHMVAITLAGTSPAQELDLLAADLREKAPIVPVWCGPSQPGGGQPVPVVIGHPVPPQASMDEVRQAIHRLRDLSRSEDEAGTP